MWQFASLVVVVVLASTLPLSDGKPSTTRPNPLVGALWNLEEMTECRLHHNALVYNNHGCWCGRGGCCTPVDPIDEWVSTCQSNLQNKATFSPCDSLQMLYASRQVLRCSSRLAWVLRCRLGIRRLLQVDMQQLNDFMRRYKFVFNADNMIQHSVCLLSVADEVSANICFQKPFFQRTETVFVRRRCATVTRRWWIAGRSTSFPLISRPVIIKGIAPMFCICLKIRKQTLSVTSTTFEFHPIVVR